MGNATERERERIRGQVPLTIVEAVVGVLLLATVTFTFALGVPGSTADDAQLDIYASDTATILSTEGPRHADQTRLAEVVASQSAFDRERAELRRRVQQILPPNLLFRIETRHGTVGHRLPAGVQTGQATVQTVNGDVTVRVWYA
jgi:hypothetical protein